MKITVPVAVTVVIGVIVLFGYFAPQGSFLQDVRDVLLQWAVILAAFAMLVGIANLVRVHARKVQSEETASFYSGLLLVSFFLTLGIVVWFGPNSPWSLWLFNNIQIPVESSLLAVLAIALVYAAVRLLARRLSLFSVLFVLTAVVILLGTAPLFVVGEVAALREARLWISQVPAVAGARGILLGVALGTIATGVRILIGSDRPYGG